MSDQREILDLPEPRSLSVNISADAIEQNTPFTLHQHQQDQCLNNNEMEATASEDKFVIVFFDVETSGLGRSEQILQLAAKTRNSSFSAYVTPFKFINPSATEIHKLTNRNGELFRGDAKVPSQPLHQVLQEFLNFLKSLKKPSLLVAHNVKFDQMMIIQALKKESQDLQEFRKWIIGFADTLLFFGNKFPERKGKQGQLKLQTLVSEFIPEKVNDENFHDATYDVDVLQELFYKFGSPQDLFAIMKTFDEAFVSEEQAEQAPFLAQQLTPLKGKLSDNMIKKLASNGIALNSLEQTCKAEGFNGLKQLLASPGKDGKPLVIKPQIINTIANHFSPDNADNSVTNVTHKLGLQNLGAKSSYFNAAVQALFFTEEFKNIVINFNENNYDISPNQCPLAKEMKNLFEKLSRSNSKSYCIPKKLFEAANPENLKHDSAEFIRYLFQCFEERVQGNVTGQKQSFAPHAIFRGTFNKVLQCNTCTYKLSNTPEKFHELQLLLPGNLLNNNAALLNMQCLIEDHFKIEGNNEYFCENCSQVRDCLKGINLVETPEYLIIVIKYFAFNNNTGVYEKIQHRVQYEDCIQLFAEGGAEFKYQLYAIIIHAGPSLYEGQYYTCAKDSTNSWFKLHDRIVSPIAFTKMQESEDTPYILFYKKMI